MTANWPPPGTQQPPGTQPQAPPGYGYNWGLAYPLGYAPVSWIPRPPRPGVVNLAVILTIAGVLISGVQLVINLRYLYLDRDEVFSQLNERTTANGTDVYNAALVVGFAIGALFWLVPAVGALVTALLARRGSNAARIVLASLMGVFALNDLCNGVFGLVSSGFTGLSAQRQAGISPAFNLVLAVLAVVIGVLVLVPSAHRYFSPGPGRRFMTST